MQVGAKKAVTINYTLTDDQGEILDSSVGSDPLVYLHGADNIIPGLEKALEGKSVGDRVQVTVEPEEGYGEYNEAMTQVVPREMFQGVETIEVGMQFQAQTSGGVQVVSIAKVEGDEITIDGNHPLAGKVLSFDVEILDVRDATEEEIAHGHVHDGGHGH